MASEQELKQKMAMATAAFLRANWPEAERLYQEVLKQQPANPAMVAVGRTYLSIALASRGQDEANRGLLDEALTEARQAVKAFQRTNEPPESIALAHRAIGMSISYMIAQEVIRNDEWSTLFPEGIAALKKAIELDPEDREAHKYLGLLHSAQHIAKLRGAKTGGCFIVTATYQTPLAPEVIVFRQFRDEVLLSSKVGVPLIRFYYFVSPAIARFISKHELLRAISRQVLCEPLLRLIKR
ncbi:MAG TPA: CFI-box-CTERM domain-containing protein [Pyrinomonadaceae bacterium]|nr:CFI-box-CTERM domain-containing protein [Pyrinomonadaceae bacterium]